MNVENVLDGMVEGGIAEDPRENIKEMKVEKAIGHEK